METYTILQSRDGEVPLRLATELSRILERPTGEVSRCLKDHPWIPLEQVPAVHLDAIFDLLNGEGVVAKAVPDIHMPKFPRALRVRDADPLPNALFLQVAEPPSPAAVPWHLVVLVAAGKVTLTEAESEQIYGAWRGGAGRGGAGIPTPGSAPMGGRSQAKEPFLVDIVTGGVDPVRLRIEAGHFNYDYLEGRMKPVSRENFRLLLTDIRQRSPKTLFSRPTTDILAEAPARSYRFRSLKAFESYERWVLQAHTEEGDKEAGAT